MANEKRYSVNEQGMMKISDDVIATIARIAALEIPGVTEVTSTFSGEIKGFFGNKKSQARGIDVKIEEDKMTVDISITVQYGNKIPDIACAVQDTVTSNIESMTGYTVSAVNVNVVGINFEPQTIV